MSDSTKRCCTCNEYKSFEDFNRYSKSPDGRQPRCRECQKIKRVEWYAKNRESEIKKAREWNLANPERVRQIDRKRASHPRRKRQIAASQKRHRPKYKAREARQRRENPERFREIERLWRARNKESIAERKRRYRTTNPNIAWQEKAKTHRRRALAKIGPSAEEIQQKMEYHGYRCWICGDISNSVDHVKPLAAGGPHILANLRPACIPCNSRKHARWYGAAELDKLVEWVLLHPAA